MNDFNFSELVQMWIPDVNDQTPAVFEYAKNAAELCLLMNIQDPPMFVSFDCSDNRPFNKELFSAYTRDGHVYEYLVWPAVLLHEAGSIVRKGVAQGKGTKPKKKKNKDHLKNKHLDKGHAADMIGTQEKKIELFSKDQSHNETSSAKSGLSPNSKRDLIEVIDLESKSMNASQKECSDKANDTTKQTNPSHLTCEKELSTQF